MRVGFNRGGLSKAKKKKIEREKKTKGWGLTNRHVLETVDEEE